MNCGPDNKKKGDDDEKSAGGGGGCRDRAGFLACLLDVGVDYGLGSIPYAGHAYGLSGLNSSGFQSLSGRTSGLGGFKGPGAHDVSGAGGAGAKRSFNQGGGQAQLDHYNRLNTRNGLGIRPDAARRSLSNLRIAAKGLSKLGFGLGLLDTAFKGKDCYDTYCK